MTFLPISPRDHHPGLAFLYKVERLPFFALDHDEEVDEDDEDDDDVDDDDGVDNEACNETTIWRETCLTTSAPAAKDTD